MKHRFQYRVTFKPLNELPRPVTNALVPGEILPNLAVEFIPLGIHILQCIPIKLPEGGMGLSQTDLYLFTKPGIIEIEIVEGAG